MQPVTKHALLDDAKPYEALPTKKSRNIIVIRSSAAVFLDGLDIWGWTFASSQHIVLYQKENVPISP